MKRREWPLDNCRERCRIDGIETQPQTGNSGKDEPARFIAEELDGARLDKAVRQHFDLPWNKARAWIDTGKVFINGTRIAIRDRSVKAGDRIELRMGAPKAQPAPDLDPKGVIFYDDDIVISSKPAGLMTVPHPDAPDEPTLDRLTLAYLRHVDPGNRHNKASLGVVHRIDKETSGLVVFARSPLAHKSLSEQFRAHAIERQYLAIVHGIMKPQTIRSRLVRDAGDGMRGSVAEGRVNQLGEALGREAVTHVAVEQALQGATLVSCRIDTGRTHQIRIHLSEAGHPIVGEKVYIRGYAGTVIPGHRAMLHAAELGFTHPTSGQPVKWVQPLPQDFKNRLRSLLPPRQPSGKQ